MYTCEFKVQPSNVSSKGTLKLRSLLDYFQDTAGLAVEDIEGTTTELIARGYAWVLTRYEIEILEGMPRLDEKFLINTYHDPSHGYNMLRAFEVKNSGGQEIIKAKSSWFLVELAKGRPVKSAVHLPEVLKRDTGDIDPNFQELKDFPDEEIIKSVDFQVKFHDLDYNSHVNNAIYFGWVYDECPIDFETHEVKKIFASFRSGAKFGEKVKLNFARPSENIFACSLLREGVAKPGANFIFQWE